MLFNSIEFLIFLPIVFVLYWFVFNRSLKAQNVLLLICSYYFYSCWDWRFTFLLAFSTGLDFFSGLAIANALTKRSRKFWLLLSVAINLGLLGFFKYYNFFVDSFAELLTNFGFEAHFSTLSIILPIGISFYTFHGLSYVFDIYNRKIEPTTNFIQYSLFVSFFPLLVAGPIERATHLLPQIERPRIFDNNSATDGLRQILWGFVKKVVIADNCAEYANLIFNNSSDYSGSTLVLGALFFTFQIYGDFSGYTDIAIGTAKLFGINLLRNFAFPYFSRDIAEFWRRWHISLSSWFRDYLYIPLGGSKGGNWVRIRNMFIIFLVSGFWHGANWTFIIWGGLNALFMVPLIWFKTNRKNVVTVAQGRSLPSLNESIQMATTFMLTVFAWIFFRAESLSHAFQYVSDIFSANIIQVPEILTWDIIRVIMLVFIFMVIEWFGREDKFAIERLMSQWPLPFRWSAYYILTLTILHYRGEHQTFIYFQF